MKWTPVAKYFGPPLMPHFNIGKSKLSSLPIAIRLARLAELIAFVLMASESKSGQYEAGTISIVFLPGWRKGRDKDYRVQ